MRAQPGRTNFLFEDGLAGEEAEVLLTVKKGLAFSVDLVRVFLGLGGEVKGSMPVR